MSLLTAQCTPSASQSLQHSTVRMGVTLATSAESYINELRSASSFSSHLSWINQSRPANMATVDKVILVGLVTVFLSVVSGSTETSAKGLKNSFRSAPIFNFCVANRFNFSHWSEMFWVRRRTMSTYVCSKQRCNVHRKLCCCFWQM